MKVRIFDFFNRYSVALAWVYFTLLFLWLGLYLILGSGGGYLDMVNNLAVYLFFPLPLIIFVAVITRRRELLGASVLASVAFLWFWGGLFLPNPKRFLDRNAPSGLTVMTYNVLGLQGYIDPIIAVIRTEDADVICLQEVNATLANVLQNEFAEEYPYQFLDPQEGVHGLGTISRYPLVPIAADIPLHWVGGTPQVFELDYGGGTVLLLNFHAHPYSFGGRENFLTFQKHRQNQGHALYAFAEETSQPLILAGDANDTFLTGTYQNITSGSLRDVWREAGFGLGHTFPGSDLPGSSRLHVGSWYIPQWLTRIDYIFVSPQWEVISARVAEFDGVSDHRGVIAELVLGE